MDPQQELFTALRAALIERGYDVYDGALPPDGTPYPFLYLGESRQRDEENKSAIFGRVYQTVHVWHDSPRRRGTVSALLAEIKRAARDLRYSAWHLRTAEGRVLTDTTTTTPLLHGVLELEFQFCSR